MNLNPFKQLDKEDKTTDRMKKLYHKKISKKAWEISMKVMTRRPITKDIEILEGLYNGYYKKYPDKDGEERARLRIKQLKTIGRQG